jgi:hypothetical protein
LNKISNLSLALGSYIGNSEKSLFCSVFSTNLTMEQNWWHFCKALLHLKVNYVFRIPKFWVLRVPPIQIPTQNGKMKILNFVNLKVSYKFQILNAFLNYLVCNKMKVFTRPTSASDFFSLNYPKMNLKQRFTKFQHRHQKSDRLNRNFIFTLEHQKHLSCPNALILKSKPLRFCKKIIAIISNLQ